MVRPGEKATVSIHMNNANPVTLWQADLKLPEGITVATDEYGDEDATLAPERTSGTNHTLSIHSIAPDSIRILSSSSVNATFDGTYGKVASIVLNVASDVKDGEYFLEFNNVKIVEPSAAAHIVGNTISKFNVYNYTIGDLNEDGEVDGIDLVMLVNHIMNRPTDNGLVGAGDINRDGDINGIDYVALLNMVMGINAKSRHEVKSVESLTGNISSASLNMNPGGFGNLDIHLNASNNQCSLMQFDITLPEGISIADNGAYIIGQNASNHDVTVQRVHKNSYRVLMYSVSNARIREQQNGVISLTLTADKDMEEGTYDMHIGGQILVAADGTSIKPASTTAKLMVSEATAITTVDNDAKVDVYTTDGILVRKNVVLRSATQGLSKGVYICGDKKVIVK